MIKLLLGAGLLIVAVSMLRNRNTLRFQAGKKILLGGFALLALAAVVFPDRLNDLAKRVGVGRGADLLLYLLIVAFLFVAMNTYLKFKDYDIVLTRLSRRLAVDEALRRYGPVTGRTEGGSGPNSTAPHAPGSGD
jgi:hypothetical protein